MKAEDRKAHWDKVYAGKDEAKVSWFEQDPASSLAMLDLAGAGGSAAFIDIGGGASRLVDRLLELNFTDLTVLDISGAALAATKARLGDKAALVAWIVADVTQWSPTRRYDVWHDRAAFHFLTAPQDQNAYIGRMRQALKPGGCAIIAAFALDGPEKCSGLPVARYDARALAALLGPDFELIGSRAQAHETPARKTQHFLFTAFRAK